MHSECKHINGNIHLHPFNPIIFSHIWKTLACKILFQKGLVLLQRLFCFLVNLLAVHPPDTKEKLPGGICTFL